MSDGRSFMPRPFFYIFLHTIQEYRGIFPLKFVTLAVHFVAMEQVGKSKP